MPLAGNGAWRAHAMDRAVVLSPVALSSRGMLDPAARERLIHRRPTLELHLHELRTEAARA